jgi:transcriptional regulator with PAS, ATPase and Fis domain
MPVDARLVTRSPAMRELEEIVDRVAPAPSNMLLLGESGVGKELVARIIHARSTRSSGPFVVANCGSIPEHLCESEFFGHERGAFSGAVRGREGLFLAASGGTLFLDEVGEMPLALQAKLLRAIEQREVRPVGADEHREADVRIVAATNVDLEARVAAGAFRADLFYRLRVIQLRVPSLRERREDIDELARALLDERAARLGRGSPRLSPDALQWLREQPWPGNVRELGHLLERVLVLSRDDVLTAGHLRGAGEDRTRPALTYADARSKALHEFERTFAVDVLARAGGSIGEAARLAGLDKSSFRRLLRRCGLLAAPEGDAAPSVNGATPRRGERSGASSSRRRG